VVEVRQQRQRLVRLASKPFEELVGKPAGRNRGHEAGALRLPRRGQGEVSLSPLALEFQGTDWYRQHRRPAEVRGPSEKMHRNRGAPLAAETEPRVAIALHFRQARAWLARIVGEVENVVTEKTFLRACAANA
jgi:hypothetical protein